MNKKELEVKKFFDEYKAAYDNSWDHKEHTLHIGIFNCNESLQESFENSTKYLESLVQRYNPLKPDSKLLDLCCGTGRTLLYLTDNYGGQGTGIDISEEQINDANMHTNKRCSFIEGSISNLTEINRQKYTHVISQDGIFLTYDKKKCYEQIYNSLEDGGLLVISDFLSQKPASSIDKERAKGMYETVKWEKGLSFEEYKQLLFGTGFKVLLAEERTYDMKQTYQKLIYQTTQFIRNENDQYDTLTKRYRDIVAGIDNKEIGWGWFVAQKVN